MRTTKQIASMLLVRYEKLTNTKFEGGELKLQKLMYFLQKYSYAITGKFILIEDFEAWIHGPVLPSLRGFLKEEKEKITTEFSENEIYTIDNVIYTFGGYEDWYLRNLSHLESSWINARKGLKENQKGNCIIKKGDIIKDTENLRIYDYVYDMYLDEFENLEEYEF